MSEGPYSRVYWTVLDDKKFDGIRADVRHFGSWTLMLVVADMSYPAPAFIPPTVPRASIKALVEVGLVDLLPARMYRIRGLRKEREQRSDRGRKGADVRWSSNATALRTDSERTPTGLLDETKQSKDETRQDEAQATPAPDVGLDVDEGRVFAFVARFGASIREDSPLGRRLIGLIERRGAEEVLRTAGVMARASGMMSDRQWVLGLENSLEQIPTSKDARKVDLEEENRKHTERVQADMAARRAERERWMKPESVA